MKSFKSISCLLVVIMAVGQVQAGSALAQRLAQVRTGTAPLRAEASKNLDTAKSFAKEHKKTVAAGVATTGGIIVLLVALYKNLSSKNSKSGNAAQSPTQPTALTNEVKEQIFEEGLNGYVDPDHVFDILQPQSNNPASTVQQNTTTPSADGQLSANVMDELKQKISGKNENNFEERLMKVVNDLTKADANTNSGQQTQKKSGHGNGKPRRLAPKRFRSSGVFNGKYAIKVA